MSSSNNTNNVDQLNEDPSPSHNDIGVEINDPVAPPNAVNSNNMMPLNMANDDDEFYYDAEFLALLEEPSDMSDGDNESEMSISEASESESEMEPQYVIENPLPNALDGAGDSAEDINNPQYGQVVGRFHNDEVRVVDTRGGGDQNILLINNGGVVEEMVNDVEPRNNAAGVQPQQANVNGRVNHNAIAIANARPIPPQAQGQAQAQAQGQAQAQAQGQAQGQAQVQAPGPINGRIAHVNGRIAPVNGRIVHRQPRNNQN